MISKRSNTASAKGRDALCVPVQKVMDMEEVSDNGRSVPDGLSPFGSSPAVSPVPASIPSAGEIPNPIRWYYHREQDAEWWHRGGVTRDDAIDKGIAEYEGEPFYIAECKSMVPNFHIFDADDICERLGEDEEAWWEDGWTGEPLPPAKRELENRLEAAFKQWFAEYATLDGACLDQLGGEFVTAQAIEARRGKTRSGLIGDESAVAKPCAQGDAA